MRYHAVMKALLLVAGQSKRFWPLKEKPLFPILGKPLVTHQIERLRAGGVDDIVVIGSADNLDALRALHPELTFAEQEDLSLGMRGALLSALPDCGNEAVLIVGGNDVFDPSAFSALRNAAAKNGARGAILAQEVDAYFPGGYLSIEGDRIVGIMEKPGAGNEPSNLVNIVAHVHNDASALLGALQTVDESTDDGYEQALQTLFDASEYRAVPYDGTWQAVKYPWHMLDLLEVLLQEIDGQYIHESATIHDTAVITGNVIIEEGAKIMPHATVVGPCYIGKHAVVANNALARMASVGERSVVGYNTEVKSSVLHSHVWTHMSYIGDSVIGRNTCFGAGSITGNYRLDEESVSSTVRDEAVDTGREKLGAIIGANCRFGIQSALNPGIKVGAGSFVSAATLVSRDIEDNMFARMKNGELKVSENASKAPDPEGRTEYMKRVKNT